MYADRRQWARTFAIAALVAHAGGCGGDPQPDAGSSTDSSIVSTPDGGMTSTDAGAARNDAGAARNDAGTLTTMDGGGGADATMPTDGGSATSTSETVGPAGGSIEHAGVTLRIPRGALDNPTEITITSAGGSYPGYAPMSSVFRFEPEGLEFAVGATVTFTYAGTGDVPAIYWTEDGDVVELPTSRVAASGISAHVMHFSMGFVAPARSRPTSVEVDEDGDGSADERTTYTYDSFGRLTEVAVDTEGECTFDRTQTCPVGIGSNYRCDLSCDLTPDGTADQRTTYEYDEYGNLVRETADTTGRCTTATCNACLGECCPGCGCYDIGPEQHETCGADGTPDRIVTHTYNDRGQPSLDEIDEDGDGEPDERTTYTYDTGGRLTEIATDTEGDCTYNRTDTCAASGSNIMCELSCDLTPDGMADTRTTYDYDPTGNLVRETTDTTGRCTTASCTPCIGECCPGCGCFDAGPEQHETCGADGDPDRIVTHAYDAAGHVTRDEIDEDGDGSPDERTTYAYDAGGRLAEVATDTEGSCTYARVDACPVGSGSNIMCELSCDLTPDGEVDVRTTYEYGFSGDLVREAVDTTGRCTTAFCTPCFGECCPGCGCVDDGPEQHEICGADGSPDRIVTHMYDSAGHLALDEIDEDGDGNVDERTTYTYDHSGRVSHRDVDTAGSCTYNRIQMCPSGSGGSSFECELSCDTTPDGVTDVRTTYTYDASGTLAVESVDSTGDCTTVSCAPCYGECCSGCGGCFDTGPVQHEVCRADGTPDRVVTY